MSVESGRGSNQIWCHDQDWWKSCTPAVNTLVGFTKQTVNAVFTIRNTRETQAINALVELTT